MVANVSDVQGTSASGRATDDAATGTDGFLQELLGIVGMMPAMAPPPAQPADASVAGTSATEVADAVSGSAKTNADALRTIPAWLSTAVDEAMPVANTELAANAQTLPATDSIDAQPALPVASFPAPFEIPEAAAEMQVPSASDQTTSAVTSTLAKSMTPPVEMPRGVKEAQAPMSDTSAQTKSAAASDVESLPLPASAPVASSTEAVAKTSSAAPAIDIDNLLASLGRSDRESSRAAKSTGSAVPGVNASGAKSEAAATESAAALDVSTLHAKPEKLLEEKLPEDKAETASSTAKQGDVASTQFSSLQSNRVETRDTQEISSRQLTARLGTAEWKDQLGAQLNWMVDNGKHSASLKLTPENLGPVEVRIDVNQNQTSVWFSAANADTRTALEQALPRLRELMASNGMSLNDAGVFREPPRDQRGSSNSSSGGGAQNNLPGSFGSRDSGEEAVAVVRRRLSLLDTYA